MRIWVQTAIVVAVVAYAAWAFKTAMSTELPVGSRLDVGPVAIRVAAGTWPYHDESEWGDAVTEMFRWPDMEPGSSVDIDDRILVSVRFRCGWARGTSGMFGGYRAVVREPFGKAMRWLSTDHDGSSLLYKTDGRYKYYSHSHLPAWTGLPNMIYITFGDGQDMLVAECARGLVPTTYLPGGKAPDSSLVHPRCVLWESLWMDRYPAYGDGSTPFNLQIEIPAADVGQIDLIDRAVRREVDKQVLSFDKLPEQK